MYNPRDYQHKKMQVRKQKRIIFIMAAIIGLLLVVSIAQQKELHAADELQWQCREKMWNAYDKCDSLNHRIVQLECEKWDLQYINNK